MTRNHPSTVVEQCELLLRLDHRQHEEIVGNLQASRDSYAIPFLRKAIELKPRLKHLEYDDYGSYYKKCLWALQAIGTKEAVEVIAECARSEDEVLREQAAYRLRRIRGEE